MFETSPISAASRVSDAAHEPLPLLQSQVPTVTVAVAKTSPSYPNPSMHIDPSLNMLVIEFHNALGTLTSSTPTPRQLDAYRISMSSGAETAKPAEQSPKP